MSYIINKYTGAAIATVEDGTIDQTLDIKLIGKNYAGYGEIQNENFVFLLENFSGISSPPKPIQGQVWFDSSKNKLKYYTGDKWKSTGGAEVSPTPPTGLSEGDFWWDTSALQVKIFDGTEYILIGPQRAGNGTTLMRSRLIKGTDGNYHPVIEAVINDKTSFVISWDQFEIDTNIAGNGIEGFLYISAGITLVNVFDDGISQYVYDDPEDVPDDAELYYYWGTASDSAKLGGIDASEYLRKLNPHFTTLVWFDDVGYVLGNDQDLHVFIEDGDVPVIENQLGNRISFRVNEGTQKEIFNLRETGILPADTLTFDVGSASLVWNNVYADRFIGTADKADTVLVGSSYLYASEDNVISTLAVRNSTGTIKSTYFDGIAIKAQYADLAEIYVPDKEYPVGTVVVLGGTEEITVSGSMNDDRVLGVVSENPAYLMNSEANGLPIALKGKVPVFVVGAVKKGDCLVTSYIPGVAIVDNSSNKINVFAKAVEDSSVVDVKMIMAVVI